MEPRCVYCLSEDVPFTKEHVIPRAFGSFENNLTLAPEEHPTVCYDCNQRFGDTLDLTLGRDSLEALQRFHEGVADPEKVEKYFWSNVQVTLPQDGPYGPVRIRFVKPRPNTSVLGIEPVPQVCFQHKDGSWICYTEDELAKFNPKSDPDLLTKGLRLFYAESDGEGTEERLVDLLASKGITFEKRRPIERLPDDEAEITADIESEMTVVLSRAIAKIAFNHMTWVMYPEDAAFPYRQEFDAVRTFIREGSGRAEDFVIVRDAPILVGDGQRVRRTNGHLVTLKWQRQQPGGVISLVSPFNFITYRVILARRMSGVWRDIRAGHVWDLQSGKAGPLKGERDLIIPPPPFQLP
jgi:hypothetical protein